MEILGCMELSFLGYFVIDLVRDSLHSLEPSLLEFILLFFSLSSFAFKRTTGARHYHFSKSCSRYLPSLPTLTQVSTQVIQVSRIAIIDMPKIFRGSFRCVNRFKINGRLLIKRISSSRYRSGIHEKARYA